MQDLNSNLLLHQKLGIGPQYINYEKMIEYLIETEQMTEQEAIEWIQYNTIRALPYMGSKAPIIIKELP